MSAYYNEHDPFAAAWLRELIKAGYIAPGTVDERSIEDVLPSDLRGFTQCHFFAGIGVWSYALRLAGWPDDRPVWTGSCPCQPFSAAGKRAGTSDERHLWPSVYHLLTHVRPVTFFGEQVASKDGLAWLDTVQADLEAAGYSVGATDLCSAGFGAPHIRQRLYFVGTQTLEHSPSEQVGISGCTRLGRETSSGLADPNRISPREEWQQRSGEQLQSREDESPRLGPADNNNTGLEGRQRVSECAPELPSGPGGLVNRVAEFERGSGWQERTDFRGSPEGSRAERLEQRPMHGGLVNGFWAAAEWIPCRDQKFRPIEPVSSPLATGITNRVGKLRGYGNALTAQVAQGFIEAYLEIEG